MFNIFKKNYKVVIDGSNTAEATQAMVDVLNYYGEVFDIDLNQDIVENKTNDPKYLVHILYVKATPKKFRRFKKVMLKSGQGLTEIKGYYFV